MTIIQNSTFIIKDTDLYKICIFNVESMDSGIVINNGDIEEFIVNNLKVDTLEITKSRINKKIIFNGVELNKLSLENSSFQCLLDLRNVKIKSMININEFKNFTNVYLPYMDEPNIIMDLVLHNNNSNFIKSKEFKKLKQISNQNYDYPLEDYFYIWEKRMQREQYTKFQKFIDERFWDKCIGYGMEPVKLWKFLYRVFLFFTALFLIPNTLTSLSDSISIHWYDKIYFSAITFLTIGYGDLQPIGIGKIIAPIEGFFGLLLTGGFVAILLRKLIRK